jgi:hypothetical protein
MRCKGSFYRTRIFTAALMLLACSGAAWAVGGSYDPATGVLSADFVTLGAARYTGMQVTVSSIVRGPMGGSANGSDYSYDTSSNQLTIPSVTVGNTAYLNVVATVGSLVSSGLVSGADVYDGAYLAIPYVQVGATDTVYANVVIAIGRVVRLEGGMPNSARDIYDPGTGQLTIGAVQFGSNIYTNVVVTVRTIVSIGGKNPQPTLGPNTLDLHCLVFPYPYCAVGSAQLLNTGTKPLNISDVAINSPIDIVGDPVFEQTNDCPETVEPGQSCAIGVYLTITDGGPNQGTLTVTDDGAGSPRVVALRTN